ncbi:MAG: DUF445 family protein [Bacteroidia bacterium]|nr:DUF445 family protein [Bacteroidia bacterium]
MERLKPFFERHFPFGSLLQQRQSPDDTLSFNRFKLPAHFGLVMAALRLSPWICGLGFAVTYLLTVFDAWIPALDAAGSSWVQAVNVLSVSGLIGYGTNYIAIRMLFRPIERRPIWGQGLIPAQRDRIIFSLAKGMHTHILSQELIRKRIEETGLVRRINELLLDGSAGLLSDQELRAEVRSALYELISQYANRSDVRQEIRMLIDQQLEQNFDGGLKKFLLQTYKRYNKEDYHEVIDRIVADIPRITQDVIRRLEPQLDAAAEWLQGQKPASEAWMMQTFADLLDRIDITSLLAQQMAHFDEQKLERMIRDATNEQLLYIQYLGAVLGVLGGMLIWQPAVMGPVFLAGLAAAWGLDEALYRYRKARS